MVFVSQELPAQTEARLRGVFQRSRFDWLPGRWTFREGDLPAETASLARIRDHEKLSALSPDSPEHSGGDRFAVFRVVLPAGEDDSGFVGWLSSRIKARTGSGVFVICGHDRERGGVFDYYGVPVVAADDVRRVIEPDRSPESLDGVVLAARATDPSSQLDAETVFCLEQDQLTLTGRYGGGRIRDGWLAGTISATRTECEFQYLQITNDGEIASGRSRAELGKTVDGRWTLTEHFSWTSHEGTGTNYLEEPLADRHPRVPSPGSV
jgi:hypothetical protein